MSEQEQDSKSEKNVFDNLNNKTSITSNEIKNLYCDERIRFKYLFCIPLCHAQRRFWYLYYNNIHGHFTEEISLQFPIYLFENNCLKNSINSVIMLNKLLRSTISTDGMYHVVHSGTESFFPLQEQILLSFNNEVIKITGNSEIPLRFCFTKKNNDVIMLYTRFHNILVDGKSIRFFIKQLLAFVNHTEKGHKVKICTQKNEYFEFCIVENELISKNEFSETIQYWLDSIKDYVNQHNLIFRKLYNNEISSCTKVIDFVVSGDNVLSETVYHGIKHLAIKNNATIFSTMVSILRILLYKMFGINEIPFGIPVDNRLAFADSNLLKNANFLKTIGVFLNFCISKTCINSGMNGNEFIKQNSNNIINVLKHSKLPFDIVIKNIREKLDNKNISFENLFQIVVIQDTCIEDDINNFNKLLKDFYNIKIIQDRSKHEFNGKPQYPMMWHFIEEKTNKRLRIRIEYNPKCFSPKIVNTMVEKYNLLCEKILCQINENQELFTIDSLSLLSSADIKHLNINYKNCFQDYPIMHPVDSIMSVLQTLPSNKIVIEDGYNQKLNAEELYNLSQSLYLLLEPHVSALRAMESDEIIIAILHERNINLVPLILSAWLAGASILPISNEWSEEKIYSVLNEFPTKIIFITDRKNYLNDWRYKILMSDIMSKTLKNKKQRILSKNRNWWNILYLTFTSGSTGKPKIVTTEAHALMSFVMRYTKLFFYDYDSIVYQVVNYAFDIFFSDLLISLINGSLLLLAKENIPNPRELIRCSHAYIMPSYLSQLSNKKNFTEFSNLKVLQFGGETISKKWLTEAVEANLPLVQLFGLTETTIYSAYEFFFHLSTKKKLPRRKNIGLSFPNAFLFMIDKDNIPIPSNVIGTKGNLCISGIDVSRGYIFIPNNHKFNKNSITGFRYFITNDLVMMNDDSLEFIGRSDHIIKIRGNLIVPSEIENIILNLMPQITNCVVCVKADKLIAFIQIENNKNESIIKSLLRERLIKKYPKHIIPNEILIVRKFILSSNGKIDRKYLLNVPILKKQKEYNNEIQNSNNILSNKVINDISKIFAKNFGLKYLEVDKNIFEKGADSLKILMAIQEVETKYNFLININDVFKYPTISSLLPAIKYEAKAVINKSKIHDSSNSTSVFEFNKFIPLSYNQEHLWFLHNFNAHQANDAYIIQLCIQFNKQPNIHCLVYAINCLLQNNAILRTVVKTFTSIDINENELLYQQILSGTESFISLHDTDADKSNHIIDISSDIPIKIIINFNNNNKSNIKILFHHISVDGISLNLISNQLVKFYQNGTKKKKNCLSNNTFQYAKFAIDQRSNNFNNELKYWKKQLDCIKNVIFYSKNKNKKFVGSESDVLKYNLQIPNDLLQKFVIKYSCTLTQIFIASYLLTLYNEIPNEKIAIGTPFANRTLENDNVIGYFAAMHAICFTMNKKESINDFIEHVRQQILDASSYAHTPFELIVKELQPKRQFGFNPIFQRGFSYEKSETKSYTKNKLFFNDDLYGIFEEKNSNFAKFDQYWKVCDVVNNLNNIKKKEDYHLCLIVEYNKHLFSQAKIKKSINDYKIILNNLLNERIEKISFSSSVTNVVSKLSHHNGKIFNDLNMLKIKVNTIWCQVLQLNKIDNGDNFFEIGGHSFLANRICLLINNKLNQNIKLADLFKVNV